MFATIIQGKYLVLFNKNQLWDSIEVIYNKKPWVLVNDDDEIDVPDDQLWMCIKYIAVGEMMYNRWEETRAKEVFLFGIGKLRELYSFYNNQSNTRLNGKKIWMGRNNFLNF
jgi:hypothetical protein